MGYPELPGESADNLRQDVNHINNLGGPIPSDDSDNEDSNDAYDGYLPLPIGENEEDTMDMDNHLMDESQHVAAHSDTNLPHVESIDAEVERQVWSAPRPRELQIELDQSRTQQIMSAMASFTLPNVTVPDWALGVSEERWKEQLLERIRQQNKTNTNEVTADDTADGKKEEQTS